MAAPANTHRNDKAYGFKCPVFKTAVLGNSVAIVTTDRERKQAFGDSQSASLTHRGGYHALLSGALGESLLTDDDAKYVSIARGLFEPLLNKKAVEKYMGTIYTVIQRHMDMWERDTSGIKIYMATKSMYADVLFEIFFGKNAKSVDEKQVLKDCARMFTGATSFPVSGGGFFSSQYDKGLKSGKRLRKVYREQLLLHMADIQRTGDKDGCDKEPTLIRAAARQILRMAGDGSRKSDPFLTCHGPHKSLLDATADHFALFSTGLTSKLLASLSVSFLRVLSNPRHQGVLEKMRTEVKDQDPRIAYAKLSQLCHLDRLCLEVQRVYPPLAGLARGAEKSNIDLAGYKIPKGWMVWSCNYIANRDPSVFKEADKFDPTRWGKNVMNTSSNIKSDEKNQDGEQHLHLAFGFGKRKCPGFHLALSIWKAFCFTASRQYSWRLQRQAQATGTVDGDDLWRVKWIPVYSPNPDVIANFVKLKTGSVGNQ